MYNKIIKRLLNVSLTRRRIKKKKTKVCISSWIINRQKMELSFDLSRLFVGKTLVTFPSGDELEHGGDLNSFQMKENSEILIKLLRNVKLTIFFYSVLTLFPLCCV